MVRLALPVPGDLTGLPGPDLRRAALASGAAAVALADDGAGCLGLVPRREPHGNEAEGRTVTVTWSAFVVAEPAATVHLPLTEADQALTAALTESTQTAGPRHRAVAARAGGGTDQLRRTARSGTDEGSWLPPGYPARAGLLLTRAAQLGRVVELATADDPGGAVTGSRPTPTGQHWPLEGAVGKPGWPRTTASGSNRPDAAAARMWPCTST